MNIIDNINYLASINASHCFPKRKEYINETIPYFEIKKDSNNKYTLDFYNYENHDNANRSYLWKSYIETKVFPNIDSDYNISGFYNIELHDSYTYLNNNKNYDNVLCFSKFKKDTNIPIIPDPYMLNNYNRIHVNDITDWNKKYNKVIFCGTTTGNTNPELNERINTCLWGLNKPYCDFYITKIAQIKKESIDKINKFNLIYKNIIPIEEQIKYKFHLCLDGNTSRYDIWYYNTTTIIFKKKSKEMLWYYPLLQNRVHFTEIDQLEDIEKHMNIFNNNPNLAYNMIINSKEFHNNINRPIIPQLYLIKLFETMAENR